MLADTLVAATRPNGMRVYGWIAAYRNGPPKYLDLKTICGRRSGILMSLDVLSKFEPLQQSDLQAA